MFLLFLVYIPQIQQTLALPTPPEENATANATIADTVGWTEAPQVRGTFDLLLSCFTTLALCAWTAYHPNVQGSRSFWAQTGHRSIWMVIAILVPEVVLYCAWSQWWTSRKLRQSIDALGDAAFDGKGDPEGVWMGDTFRECPEERELRRRRSSGSGDWGLDWLFGEAERDVEQAGAEQNGDREGKIKSTHRDKKKAKKEKKSKKSKKETTQKKKETWTMEQAFFAISGGFAVDSSSFSPHSRLTFTSEGIVLLAQLGLLPNETPETVNDKSKADYVAKALVCIQATWFFVQCIGRLAQKLPLTLLELHVLAHVLCALVMYVLWIRKPYDVASPILCRDERVVDLAALFGLHVKSKSRFQSWACAHWDTINLAQVQTAHANSKLAASHKHYTKIVLEAFEYKSSALSMNNSMPVPSRTPNELEVSHLLRANRALAFLKSRNIHLMYTHSFPSPPIGTPTSSSYSAEESLQSGHEEHGEHARTSEDAASGRVRYVEFTSANGTTLRPEAPSHAITFDKPYVVAQRSNMRVDGGRFWDDQWLDPPEGGNGGRQLKEQKANMYGILALFTLSPIYGALHLAAWSSLFPTTLELWMWRASGIVMVVTPMATAILFMSFDLARPVRLKFERHGAERIEQKNAAETGSSMEETKSKTSMSFYALLACYRIVSFVEVTVVGVSGLIMAFGWLLYPFARLYVLGEAFAQLRYVEKDVYRTVEWSSFIPHVG